MATLYQKITAVGQAVLPKDTLFKYAFNWSPMYRRTTARVESISEDLHRATIKLPVSWRNRNYVGSIFGGSLYAAVDPIHVVQLINILDNQYIVWDKSAEVFFKIPAREDLYADFEYTQDEVRDIRRQADENGELVFKKVVQLMDRERQRVYCEVRKTLYVATKEHYQQKRARRAAEPEALSKDV